ncbi:MAG: KAP family NTPase, partial [Akkermansiaceae bacterium]|nr:KAP family NTPase [Akkermansiaceae bacterium]
MAEKKTDPGNEKPLFTLLSDHPIESGEGKCIDLLDLHERLRVHLDTLRHPLTVTPFSIAFYGDWGTGKTSAMRWLESQLHLWNKSETRREPYQTKDGPRQYPKLTPVWFYPWKYHNRADVWRGIIAEVILATLTTGSEDIEDFSQRAIHVAKRYGK